MLLVKVHSAGIHDGAGGKMLLERLQMQTELRTLFPRLRKLWADGGYKGSFVEWLLEVLGPLGLEVEIVEHPPGTMKGASAEVSASADGQVPLQTLKRGFGILPRRWVVERTFSWLCKHRRLSKDYEFLPQSSEAMIYVAMTRLMAKRLAIPAT